MLWWSVFDFFPAILGGTGNQAEAESSTVSGNAFNLENDLYTSISGGCSNFAGTGANPDYTAPASLTKIKAISLRSPAP